jgi:hypothetical protein
MFLVIVLHHPIIMRRPMLIAPIGRIHLLLHLLPYNRVLFGLCEPPMHGHVLLVVRRLPYHAHVMMIILLLQFVHCSSKQQHILIIIVKCGLTLYL